jgi:hypothetical protein
MSKKQKNFIVISIILIFIISLVVLGLIMFVSSSNNNYSIKTIKKGITTETYFYNSNGKSMSIVPQTTVSFSGSTKGKGLSYMSLKIKVSNTGNTKLTNLRLTNINPLQLEYSLEDKLPIQPILNVGELNVIEWDTANSCTSNMDCGSSEKCINSLCLIDISNISGEVQFRFNIEAEYKDSEGQGNNISTLINTPILFEEDEKKVTFRTSDLNYNSGWIALDLNFDGELEGYYYSGLSEKNKASCYSEGKIRTGLYTLEGYEIVKDSYGKPNICIPFDSFTNSGSSYKVYQFKYFQNKSTLAITSTDSVEPYASDRKEKYSLDMSILTPVCGNNIIEGSEICDGIDLGGSTCKSINTEFLEGTLSCNNNCSSFQTSNCISDTGQTLVTVTNSYYKKSPFESIFGSYSTGSELSWDISVRDSRILNGINERITWEDSWVNCYSREVIDQYNINYKCTLTITPFMNKGYSVYFKLDGNLSNGDVSYKIGNYDFYGKMFPTF